MARNFFSNGLFKKSHNFHSKFPLGVEINLFYSPSETLSFWSEWLLCDVCALSVSLWFNVMFWKTCRSFISDGPLELGGDASFTRFLCFYLYLILIECCFRYVVALLKSWLRCLASAQVKFSERSPKVCFIFLKCLVCGTSHMKSYFSFNWLNYLIQIYYTVCLISAHSSFHIPKTHSLYW